MGRCAWYRLARAEVKPVSFCWCWGSEGSEGFCSGLEAMVGSRVPVGASERLRGQAGAVDVRMATARRGDSSMLLVLGPQAAGKTGGTRKTRGGNNYNQRMWERVYKRR